MMDIQSDTQIIPELLQSALRKSVDYGEYRTEMSRQALNGETSGPVQSDALVGYTFLNDRRMRRWEKTFRLSDQELERLAKNRTQQTWLVLTESWCGDAAPILPVLHKIAEAASGVELRIADRDQNPELMGFYPTDGTLAIPKLLVLDPEHLSVLGTWGPRPEEPMEKVREYKRIHGKLSPEFREDLQRWYNGDKGKAIREEVFELLALE